ITPNTATQALMMALLRSLRPKSDRSQYFCSCVKSMPRGSASGPLDAYSALVLIALMIVRKNEKSVTSNPRTTTPRTNQRPTPRCRRPCAATVLPTERSATSRTAFAIALLRRLLPRLEAQEYDRQSDRQHHLHHRDGGRVADALGGEEMIVSQVGGHHRGVVRPGGRQHEDGREQLQRRNQRGQDNHEDLGRQHWNGDREQPLPPPCAIQLRRRVERRVDARQTGHEDDEAIADLDPHEHQGH